MRIPPSWLLLVPFLSAPGSVCRCQVVDLLDGRPPDLVIAASPVEPEPATADLAWRRRPAEDAAVLWEASTGVPAADAAEWDRPPEELSIGGRTVPRPDDPAERTPAPGRWLFQPGRVERLNLVRVFAPRQRTAVPWETPGGRSRIGIAARSSAAPGVSVPLSVRVDGREVLRTVLDRPDPQRFSIEVETSPGEHRLQLANPAAGETGRTLELGDLVIATPGLVLYRPAGETENPPAESRLRFWNLTRPVLEACPEFPLEGAPDPRIQHVRVGRELRRGVVLGVPSRAEARGVELRPGDRLSYALGVCADPGEGPPAIRFTIAFRRETANTVLADFRPFRPDSASRWLEHEVVIPPDVAGRGDLVFSAAAPPGAAPGPAIIGLAAPRIVRDASAGATPPNVLLVSFDCLRADHVGCYGYGRDTTPTIDGLARGGVRFAAAEAQSTWTLPSHVAMLTGCYPSALGMLGHGSRLSPRVVTLAERLREAGMATAAFVDCGNLNPEFGLYAGFDHYDYAQGGVWNLRRRAVEWFRTHRTLPVFVFLHLFNIHTPYAPPPQWYDRFVPGTDGVSPEIVRSADQAFIARFSADQAAAGAAPELPERDRRHLIDLYDAEVAHTDRELGVLLRQLADIGVLDRTLVIITGDHGEAFMEHGHLGHGQTLYEELTHVPLVFRFPGDAFAGPGGTVVHTPVELLDVAATVLDWLGLDPEPPMQAESLLPLVSGRRADGTGECFGEYVRLDGAAGPVACVRMGNWKFISGDPGELYDLENDPRESRNLVSTEILVAARARERLKRFQEENGRILDTARPQARELDPSLREELRALGYLR